MLIEVFADVVCPWCYIGEKRLEQALAQRPDLKIERRWRPFQLRPDMPQAGIPWREFAPAKFGGPEVAEAAFAHVTSVGETIGLDFNFDKVVNALNTTNPHRLILFAADQGREWEMANALFKAYFTEGRDLSAVDELAAIAAGVGLDPAQVKTFLSTNDKADEVQASQIFADTNDIRGVPFFIIEGRYTLSGAQPVEVFLRVLDYVASKEAPVK